MPWVAWLTLVGVMAIAGLPPLNGFVSEWLLLQAFLFAPDVPRPFVNMLLPLGAAVIALAAALAGYVMVKFFGVIFLGQPREAALAHARDAGTLKKVGLAWLALGCVLLGIFPTQVIGALELVTQQLNAGTLPGTGRSWWVIVPLPDRQVSYSPIIFLLVVTVVIVVTSFMVRFFYHRRVRRAPPWDCGFGRLDARMQDTAEGFGQPIRHVFQPFFSMLRELPSPFDAAPRYRVAFGDRIWTALYAPLEGIVQRAANAVAWLQQGRISTYLLYSFVTLIVLLAVVL
jgi:NADH:ubiquinone oxidoreductase subunit 5 (subunit L)/multisubunit Na+/H+ antiporter MnhA subunit